MGGGAGGGPDPAARRRRAAGRPDPDERARRRPRVLPVAGHPRRARAAGEHRGDHRRVPGGRLRPGDPGDAGDRAGRRGGRAAGGRVAVRDDPGVRRRVPAGKDRHAGLRRRGGDQQVRAARRRRRAARRVAPADPQPVGVRGPAAGHAGVRDQRGHFQRQRRHRPVPAPGRAAGRPRAVPGRGRAARGQRAGPPPTRPRSSRPARTGYLAEIAGTVRGYHEDTARQAEAVRRVQRLAAVRAELAGDDAERSVASTPRASRTRRRRAKRRARGRMARGRGRLLRARAGRADQGSGDAHPAAAGIAVRDLDPAGGAAAVRRPRGPAAVPARGEPAGLLPVQRRGVPVQAGGRGPGPDVRRRG